jgi:hypothetical protein
VRRGRHVAPAAQRTRRVRKPYTAWAVVKAVSGRVDGTPSSYAGKMSRSLGIWMACGRSTMMLNLNPADGSSRLCAHIAGWEYACEGPNGAHLRRGFPQARGKRAAARARGQDGRRGASVLDVCCCQGDLELRRVADLNERLGVHGVAHLDVLLC